MQSFHVSSASSLLLLVLGVAALIAPPTAAQPRSVSEIAPDVDALLHQSLDSLRGVVPGLSLALVQGDSVVYTASAGVHDVSGDAPVRPESGFYVASVTKPFVGLTAALLAARDSVDLDAPLSDLAPDLAFDSSGLDASRLSLRDHLTHRAGYSNEGLAYRPPFIGRLSPDQVLHVAGRFSSPAPISFRYSNEAYIVTAAILAQKTGVPWKTLVTQTVLDPLALAHTTPHMSEATGRAFAWPHALRDGVLTRIEAKADTNMHAAGGLVASAPDLARLAAAMMNDGRVDGRQVLPATAVREAVAPQIRLDARFYRFHRYAYGFGWYHADYRGERLLHHFGGFRGHHAHLSFMPDHDVGVAVVANSGSPAPHVVAAGVYDLLLDRAAPKQVANDLARIQRFVRQRASDADSLRATWTATDAEPPSRPPSTYVGRYAHPMWGTIAVEREGDALRATLSPRTATMQPAGRDTFLVDWEVGAALPLKLVFSTDAAAPTDDGASSVRWLHPQRDLGHVFRRVDP